MHAILIFLLLGIPESAGTIEQMLEINNRLRVEVLHKHPHRLSQKLCAAAQDHARYMANTGDFEHTGGKNGTPGTRAAKFQYSGMVKENLARSFTEVSDVFKGWRDSPTHWDSITRDYDEVGFGYAKSPSGTMYWVAVYGKPSEETKRNTRGKTMRFMLISD